jgi:hypothetical protein
MMVLRGRNGLSLGRESVISMRFVSYTPSHASKMPGSALALSSARPNSIELEV